MKLRMIPMFFLGCFLTGCLDDDAKKKEKADSDKSGSVEPKSEKTTAEPKKETEKTAKPQETAFSLPGVGKLDEKVVVATFKDGTKIHLQELIPDLMKLPPRVLKEKENFSKIYQQAVKVMAKMKVLSLEAQKEGIDKDPKVKEAIKDVFTLIAQQHVLEEAVKERVTEPELRAKFDELKKSIPKEDEISLKILECTSKEDAIAKLKNIAGITEEIKTKGKLLPWLRKAQLPVSAAVGLATIDDIFRTAKGTIVKLPVNLGPNKFLIFFVEDKRAYDPVSYEDARDLILRQFFFYPKVSEYIKELSDRYGVKKFAPNGKPLTDESIKEEIAPSKIPETQVIVEFGETKVTWKKIKGMVPSEELKEVLKPENYSKILDSLVTKELLSKEIEKQDLKNNPELQAKVHKTIMALKNKMFIDSKITVTQQEVKARYDEEVKILPKNNKQIRLRWIVLNDQAKAEEVLKKVRSAGAEVFSNEAKQVSLDPQSKEKGGDLGYKVKQEVGDDTLWAKLEKQANGTVLSAPYPLSGKYVVIRVEDKKEAKIPTFAESQKNIETQLRQTKSRAFVDKHYANYGVKLFNWDGTEMLDDELDMKKLEEQLKKMAAENATKSGEAKAASKKK